MGGIQFVEAADPHQIKGKESQPTDRTFWDETFRKLEPMLLCKSKGITTELFTQFLQVKKWGGCITMEKEGLYFIGPLRILSLPYYNVLLI